MRWFLAAILACLMGTSPAVKAAVEAFPPGVQGKNVQAGDKAQLTWPAK